MDNKKHSQEWVGNSAAYSSNDYLHILRDPDGTPDNKYIKMVGGKTSAPGATNDNTEGYTVGSRWIDTTNDKEYVCVDSTTAAAVWVETTAGAAGGISDVVDDTTPQLGGQLDVNGNAIGDGTRELITFTEDGSAVNHVNIENEATGSGPIISAAGDDTNVDLNIVAKGTGNVKVGPYTFDGDQTVGAGQDNYVLTYDNAGGLISLEAAPGAGGGISNVVEDTSPQLGGNLDVNGFDITSPDGTDKIDIVNGTITVQTASTTRYDVTDSGVQFGGAGARITTVNDEDDMSSDSATALATQQSIKAYSDSGTQTMTNKTITDSSNTVVADDVRVAVRNESGATLTKGTPVYISGFNVGQSLIEVAAADATDETTMPAIGIIFADVANNATGEAVSLGEIQGIDTSSFTIGDTLYVSETAGALTATKPTGAAVLQPIAEVTRVNASTGVIQAINPGVRVNGVDRLIQLVCFDFTTDVTTGDGAHYFTFGPELNTYELTDVHAEVITAGTTGTTDIQIHNVTDAVDVLSTKLTIDSGETGSDTAATAAVINTANDDVDTNDVWRIDVDAVSTTAPQGLIVRMTFTLP